MAELPDSTDLMKLPIRAVVAYAARSSRRLSSELRGIIADDILDNVLDRTDSVWTSRQIDEVDRAALVHAAGKVADAFANAPGTAKSIEHCRIVLSITSAALAGMNAILVARCPEEGRQYMVRCAQEAERVARRVNVLDEDAARALTAAARTDYETLLRLYGEHDEVVIGGPIDCF